MAFAMQGGTARFRLRESRSRREKRKIRDTYEKRLADGQLAAERSIRELAKEATRREYEAGLRWYHRVWFRVRRVFGHAGRVRTAR